MCGSNCNDKTDSHNKHHDLHDCVHGEHDCSHGRMQRFIEPCLLLLLSKKSTYGYDLMDKLDRFGYNSPDPGMIYRYLRNLEEENMVSSKWDTNSSGPAKRSYEVTKEGKEYLKAWAIRIGKNIEILEDFLNEYNSLKE